FSAAVVSFASSTACSGTGGVPRWISSFAKYAFSTASRPRNNVTISSASQTSRNVASAAATVANANPIMKKAIRPAATARPIPIPSAAAFFFSSTAASSSSSRAIADAWSATRFAAPPTFPLLSAVGVGMTPPVDDFRKGVARGQGSPDDDERAPLLLRLLARDLRRGRCCWRRGNTHGNLDFPYHLQA